MLSNKRSRKSFSPQHLDVQSCTYKGISHFYYSNVKCDLVVEDPHEDRITSLDGQMSKPGYC